MPGRVRWRVFAIVVRPFRVQPGAPIAERARLKSDDRSERVRLGRTAALEGEVRLTLSHLGGCWIRGAVVDERTAHALDLSLEASGAAKRLILPRASSCVAAAALACGWLRHWLRTKSSSKQATHPPGVVGSHWTSGSTDGEEGPTVSSPRLASAGISYERTRWVAAAARRSCATRLKQRKGVLRWAQERGNFPCPLTFLPIFLPLRAPAEFEHSGPSWALALRRCREQCRRPAARV